MPTRPQLVAVYPALFLCLPSALDCLIFNEIGFEYVNIDNYSLLLWVCVISGCPLNNFRLFFEIFLFFLSSSISSSSSSSFPFAPQKAIKVEMKKNDEFCDFQDIKEIEYRCRRCRRCRRWHSHWLILLLNLLLLNLPLLNLLLLNLVLLHLLVLFHVHVLVFIFFLPLLFGQRPRRGR